MTTEKAALQNARLFFKKGKHLVLPVIAMLYCGNYLMFVRDQNHLEKIMDRIEREVERYKHQIGVLLRLLKRYPNALECFEFILEQYVSNREASMVLFA
ncbi:hypothetical protein QR98_0074510 [Sarcoptes scabiei]|uniref:Uncharacterized protein n=1 Tax=Sarcoptes scabiei TaxID=52283 RepID=A0A132AEF3_SARSC|nr:hypothetical protein QR98_0074510 [Sarcoptes scabiei]